MTYTISQIRFFTDTTSADYLQEKTRLVFSEEAKNPARQSINGLSVWLHSTLLESNEKVTRKFIYLAICLLDQWLGSSKEFTGRLARLAGTETPEPLI